MVWKDALRDSLQSPLKIQGPNQNFDKVIKNSSFSMPLPSRTPPPCTHAWLRCRIHCYCTEYSVVSSSTKFSTMCYGYQQVRCMAAGWHLRSAHQTCARVDTNWSNLVFVITFRKIVPRTYSCNNGLESCVSRFSTICAKNQVLKLKLTKLQQSTWSNHHSWRPSPVVPL
jgi:hypothetical protein